LASSAFVNQHLSLLVSMHLCLTFTEWRTNRTLQIQPVSLAGFVHERVDVPIEATQSASTPTATQQAVLWGMLLAMQLLLRGQQRLSLSSTGGICQGSCHEPRWPTKVLMGLTEQRQAVACVC